MFSRYFSYKFISIRIINKSDLPILLYYLILLLNILLCIGTNDTFRVTHKSRKSLIPNIAYSFTS